jgi:hypothetical protein
MRSPSSIGRFCDFGQITDFLHQPPDHTMSVVGGCHHRNTRFLVWIINLPKARRRSDVAWPGPDIVAGHAEAGRAGGLLG